MDNEELLEIFKKGRNWGTEGAEVLRHLSPELVWHDRKEFILFISQQGRQLSVWFRGDRKPNGAFPLGGYIYLTIGGAPNTRHTDTLNHFVYRHYAPCLVSEIKKQLLGEVV